MHGRSLAARRERVNVAEWGEGPPVVLLHGLAGSLAYWTPFAERLAARGFRVLAVDLPGHGASPPLAAWSLASAAEALEGALAPLGVERPALVGHSFGVPLAVAWAARAPVRALALASPVALLPLDARLGRLVLRTRRPLDALLHRFEGAFATSRLGRRLVFGWFVGMRRTDVLDEELAGALLRGARRAAPVVGELLDDLVRTDLRALAARVEAPALVVWGEGDAAASANGPPLARAIRAREAVLPGVGHMPMLEAPYAFGAVVAEFLSSTLST